MRSSRPGHSAIEYAAEKTVLCQLRQIFLGQKIGKIGCGVKRRSCNVIFVIPAKTGIQIFVGYNWIPACAGMTMRTKLLENLLRLRGSTPNGDRRVTFFGGMTGKRCQEPGLPRSSGPPPLDPGLLSAGVTSLLDASQGGESVKNQRTSQGDLNGLLCCVFVAGDLELDRC